ncbi:molybdopterin-dependent oxidoreductase [Alteribacillus iranensis]|uniref:Biotin/methionine sulfoxide reductase n=1 Tax=Alteribacillus iranensis TaxID=930128 RepID=A0A1I2DJV3_9BACI|nr:molybdopterin-dependent oxidoreductase [Alteribacillus iranensis]SFE80844.1 biotin/methionine sulfoxide reductase [Alteribacillus iranensis]
MPITRKSLVGTHWGNYEITTQDGVVENVQPSQQDSNPSPIGNVLYDISNSDYRIAQPMIRSSYLRGDPNHRMRRGKESFVPVSWDEALDLAASALKKTKDKAGNSGIYAGSYGWGSAGRFHHAQSQLHRFFNMIGGYTGSVNSYSAAAAEVIIPHVLGIDAFTAGKQLNLDDVAADCDYLVAFGGMSGYNNQNMPGGVGDHRDKNLVDKLVERGTEVISISPWASDTPSFLATEWITPRPCTDTAIMLGIAYELEVNGRVDTEFINSHTVGYDEFQSYLLGKTDGIPKDASWAASLAGIDPTDIQSLASRLAAANCPAITVSLSLQRAEHGEQTYWMAVVLSAMLGAFGKPGGGVGFMWMSNGTNIFNQIPFQWGKLPQGRNSVLQPIPVARVADMLLHPGETYTYNGKTRTYPDIHCIYWAGGNPFHHHQDLNRLRRAWRKPETVIVNESVWTATARHADIIFPANTFMERNDIVCGKDYFITPSKKALDHYADSRSDYDIFSGLAERMGVRDAFTEGRDEMEWLETIYQESRANAKKAGIDLPSFTEFWEAGEPINIEPQVKEWKNIFTQFRNQPNHHPLRTPSGKIEIFSSTIDSFGYDDCRGHPRWYDKREWLGGSRAKYFPLHMVSHQPRNKLHSQLDFSRFSRETKTHDHETVILHPADARERGIKDGMITRIFNDRGSCLAGAHLSDDIMPRVISLPTGAWFCPDDKEGPESLEYHGNPNVLTPDIGTSSLAQGPIAKSCLVDIEPFEGEIPDVKAQLKPVISPGTDR